MSGDPDAHTAQAVRKSSLKQVFLRDLPGAKSEVLPEDRDDAGGDNEIVRRLRAIDSGTAKLIDRKELERRFKERLGHR